MTVDSNNQLRRLSLPPAPTDPAQLETYVSTVKRLIQDEFNRLATDFHTFKNTVVESGAITLRAVSNIATDASQYTVIVTWENPDGQPITPTHVRIRIPQVSMVWAEYEYPLSTWSYSGLAPGTPYSVEIQLIAQYETTASYSSILRNCPSVPVQATSTSEVKSRAFTTAEGVGPPEQGTGNTTTWEFPEVEGTPGSPGGSDCWWEYMIQVFDETLTGGTWVDTAFTDEIAGDADLVDFDQTDLDCTKVYRLNYREVCNSVAGAWVLGPPFVPACDWGEDCGGAQVNGSLTDAPFDSADLFAIPKVCIKEDNYLAIEDAVSGIELTPQPQGFQTIFREDDEWTLRGKNAGLLQQPMLTGSLPLVGDLTGQSDFTVGFEFKAPTTANTGTFIIINLGTKFRVSVNQVPGGFTFSMISQWEGGGQMVLTSTTIIPVDTWVSVYARVIAEDDFHSLWIDGVKEKEAQNAIPLDLSGMTDDIGIFAAIEGMELRKVYGWDRALDNAEIPGPPPPHVTTATEAAILALNPLRYFTLQGADWTDKGSTPSDIVGFTGNNPTAQASGPGGLMFAGFDGASSLVAGRRVEASFNIAASAGVLTVLFFMKRTRSTAVNEMFYWERDGTYWRGSLQISSAGAGRMWMVITTVSNTLWTTGTTNGLAIAGEWAMYRFKTYPSASMRRYASKTGSNTNGAHSTVSDPLYADANPAAVLFGESFQGGMAHFAIFAGDINLDSVYAAALSDGWFA